MAIFTVGQGLPVTGDTDLFNSRPGSVRGALSSAREGQTPHGPSQPSAGRLGLGLSLTLVRVGGGQDGAVFPLHLLHVFGNLVDKAADLFHLGDPGQGG